MKNSVCPSAKVKHEGVIIDITLIILFTALVFGLSYHPYFFGDELPAYRLAIYHQNSFAAIFQGLNNHKPRLIFHVIGALLAKWEAPRLVHAVLVAGLMAWINVLLYSVVRSLFKASRGVAWLLIATVLTSRYGMGLYFDYLTGLLELLCTALFLSALLLAWLAWRHHFRCWYAIGALVTAILTGFVHERYIVGLLAAGGAIAIAEWVGTSAQRRLSVVGWALSLSVVPLVLYWVANKTLGSLPLANVGGGQRVTLGADTLWCALTYGYNVFLGGNYGHAWFWGHYNHLHPMGKIMGLATAVCTTVMTAVIVLRKGVVWHNRWLGVGLAAAVVALIAIASVALPRQPPRFLFPVGILVSLIWIVMLTNTWRYVALSVILATNMMYLLLGSHDSHVVISASRTANTLAGSLLSVMPNGRSGIVVGMDNSWIIGGGSLVDMGPRKGDTFSTVNFGSTMHIDPFIAGQPIDPGLYDFGLAFDGFGPHRTARYRLVSVTTALSLAGASVDKMPVKSVLGRSDIWTHWQWRSQPDQVEGAVQLEPSTLGWRSVPVSALNGRWLVYRARTKDSKRTPMRLQVNWHAKQDNRFISSTIQVVYPNETWASYATLLQAPSDAGIGYVYVTLHDGAKGIVEVQLVELK